MTASTDLGLRIDALEGALVAAWCHGPGFRQRWTPDPAEMWSVRSQALAKACTHLAKLGLAGDERGNLGSELARTLATAGALKLWVPGEPPLPLEHSTDPDRDLGLWRSTRALKALVDATSEALARVTADSDLDGVRGALLEAASRAYVRGAAKEYSDAELMSAAWAHVTRRDKAGYFSGFPELDQQTGGLSPGHCWVLGAPTNWGKSSILLAMADHHLDVHGSGALYVTCEDDPETVLGVRLLCRRASIGGMRARDAKLFREELDRAANAVKNSSARGPAPIMLDGRGRRVEDLADDIRVRCKRFGIKLVLVDYLQCITTGRVTQDRRSEINHIARTLTDSIKTSGAAGVLASQLTGDDIRESRDVEHAAEVVLIGRKAEDGHMTLHVKKNKTGPSGMTIDLNWDGASGSFLTPPEIAYDDFTDTQVGDAR